MLIYLQLRWSGYLSAVLSCVWLLKFLHFSEKWYEGYIRSKIDTDYQVIIHCVILVRKQACPSLWNTALLWSESKSKLEQKRIYYIYFGLETLFCRKVSFQGCCRQSYTQLSLRIQQLFKGAYHHFCSYMHLEGALKA